MEPRLSSVKQCIVRNISIASNLEIGDTNILEPSNDAIAVQRELPVFFPNENTFNDYSTFSIPFLEANIYEDVQSEFVHENPIINVNNINITSIAAASIVQVGSTKKINAKTREINIRHFLRNPYS